MNQVDTQNKTTVQSLQDSQLPPTRPHAMHIAVSSQQIISLCLNVPYICLFQAISKAYLPVLFIAVMWGFLWLYSIRRNTSCALIMISQYTNALTIILWREIVLVFFWYISGNSVYSLFGKMYCNRGACFMQGWDVPMSYLFWWVLAWAYFKLNWLCCTSTNEDKLLY